MASGTYAKNPSRYAARKEHNVAEPLGDAPGWLSQRAREAWLDFELRLPWLNFSHRGIVEIASILVAKLRSGELGVPGMQLLRVTLGQLGATPADFRRVAYEPALAGDDLVDEFLG